MPDNDDPLSSRIRMGRATLPPSLEDADQRKAWGLPDNDDGDGYYVVELNLLYPGGIAQGEAAFQSLIEQVLGRPAAERALRISKAYFRCHLSLKQVRLLAQLDEAKPHEERCVYRIWPDFPVKLLIDRSVVTVKADAAVRAYAASGHGIVWAVIDSGIDQNHIHFKKHKTLTHDSVASLHRDFTVRAPLKGDEGSALTDGLGHGTHVAGIIAGEPAEDSKLVRYEHVYKSDPATGNTRVEVQMRKIDDPAAFHGVAPQCRLVSLKILNDQGTGLSSDVMRALQYIREEVNAEPKLLRVHGVNLSLGYEFDAEMFACGQSPLCVEVDRLVKSGVVVVTAAGNTGYGRLPAQERFTKLGFANSINDPGNAALAITVGATHRDAPHMYGVSYFSSKGPTGDGRLKPDLVAPGERITSCGTGRLLEGAQSDGLAYIDSTGTSMAAPHVSGAIAAFLSIRREFIQRPEEVKRVFLAAATSLGRERYFEGHGLVDLMRAIQSV